MYTQAANVLLVEDDSVTRKLAKRILTKSGQKRRCSLETVVRIHNSSPDVSIVVLTGSADIEMKQKARNRRADAYLIKSTDVWKSLVLHKTVGWPLR